MANKLIPMNQFLQQPQVSNYIESLLGERKGPFMVAMTTLANSSPAIKECERNSLLSVALTATGLGLELNQNFGQAWCVPYNDKNTGSKLATFQIGVNGYKQLAMRTGQYKKLNAVPVYGNQFKGYNALTEELNADFSVDGVGDPVGYVAYFELLNGFTKTIYWSKEKCEKHGKRFSKAYGTFWTKDFDAMALKTVVKHLIKNWGIMSSEMSVAIAKDQASISVDFDTGEETVSYVDNPENSEPEEYASKEMAAALLEKYGPAAVKTSLKTLSIPDVTKIPMERYQELVDDLEAHMI